MRRLAPPRQPGHSCEGPRILVKSHHSDMRDDMEHNAFSPTSFLGNIIGDAHSWTASQG